MEICKAPTLWLKVLNKYNMTHIMHTEVKKKKTQQFRKS